nr:hypothetical protein [Tanacetum cinerariifolium]
KAINKVLLAFNSTLLCAFSSTLHFSPKISSEDFAADDVVKRRNRTLVEAARKMLIFSKLLCFYGQKLLLLLATLKTDPLVTLVLGIKSLHEVTVVKVLVTAAKLKLVLLINFDGKYTK